MRPFFRRAVVALALALPAFEARAQSSLLDEPADSTAKHGRVEGMAGPLTFFKSDRIINTQSVETVPRGVLDFRVAHRFGNMATKGTDIHTLFGLDQVADIWLGLNYGITDRFMVGINRSKGAGPMGELWTGSTKYRLPVERIGSMPFRLSIAGNATYTTQTANPFNTDAHPLNELPFAHRGSYFASVLAAFSVHPDLTIQIAPAMVYRNYVAFNDANALFFVPIGTRFRISRRFSVMTEYVPMLGASRSNYRGNTVFWRGKDGSYFVPFNLGAEVETGGHVFQFSLTNTGGLVENDFMPYNPFNWGKGAFRMGFAIMRAFQVKKEKKG